MAEIDGLQMVHEIFTVSIDSSLQIKVDCQWTRISGRWSMDYDRWNMAERARSNDCSALDIVSCGLWSMVLRVYDLGTMDCCLWPMVYSILALAYGIRLIV